MDIILADDHTLVRDGLRPFLEELADNAHVIEAECFERAIRTAREAADLKLIILDLAMPGMNGLAGVREMMDNFPGIPVVILSGTHDQEAIHKAFSLGISGFIPKSAGSEVLMSALQLVMAGERYIPSQILMGTIADPTNNGASSSAQGIATAETTHQHNLARFEKLSNREQHVLELLVGGMTNKEIARSIDLKEATVKIHVKNIYRKIGVNNRAQAVRITIQPDWRVKNTTQLHG